MESSPSQAHTTMQESARSLPRVLVILGPTASGKSALAVAAALVLGGEIISADSMQVYRGLDIGTAKPTGQEMAGVPHHMVDVANPLERFSVAQYQSMGRQAIAAVTGRGRLPVVVGGTGLYVRALLYDYDFSAPPAGSAYRLQLAEIAEREGLGELARRLAAVDPVAAASIHQHDRRRIIRALEVWHATGQPLSATWSELPPLYDALKIGINLPRQELYERIDRRVEAMVASGLVEEVRRLASKGFSRALVAGQALGYKEMMEAIEGRMPLEEAVAAIKRATRQYAKRQLTWFRRERDVQWLAGPGSAAGQTLEAVLAIVEARWGPRQQSAG